MTAAGSDPKGKTIEYEWRELALPVGAVNLALASRGAVAKASATSRDVGGVINGNHTLVGWGHGNGWEAAPTPRYPNWWGDWLEIIFPEPQAIDTIVVYTIPQHALRRNKLGLRDYHVQVRLEAAWETVASVTGNVEGTVVHRFPERTVRAFRLLIAAANTGDEEWIAQEISDLARVLEVEAYRLGAAETWRTERRRVTLAAGGGPRIAVFRDDVPPVAGSAPSSPESLAELLEGAGYCVTFLDGRDLTSPEVLSPDNFQLLVHPYGRAFPLGTALYDYLAAGGHLLALGGYAFTEALQWEGGRWIATGYDPGLAASVVRHGDYFTELSEQLRLYGAPGHTLRDVAYIATAPDQDIVRREIRRSGEISGPSAVAVVGDAPALEEAEEAVLDGRWEAYVHKVRAGMSASRAMRGFASHLYRPVFSRPVSRWVPLVNAYDRCGRLRGTVGAALLHHDGLYRGSRWAYFGANNVDLFAPGEHDMRAALLEIVDFLLRDLTLHGTGSDLDCYRQGEAATVATVVDNAGSVERQAELRLAILPVEGGPPAFEERWALTLPPGAWRKFTATWQPAEYGRDLYRVEASLWLDGREYDREAAGFVVWDEQVIARGPKIDYGRNYFRRNGEQRFVLGARSDGLHLHGQAKENSLWWDREYRMMRDYGMEVVSPVFFSVYIEGLGWGTRGDELIPEVVLRQVDAQVQLAQKHGLVYALCVFFLAEDSALWLAEHSRAVCDALGRRYKDVPGILFYIFDDGWREDPSRFNAWAKECVAGFRQSGRRFLVTAELSDLRTGADAHRDQTRELDFAANSAYRTENPAIYRLMDLRTVGKSWSNAEFGRQASTGADIDLHPYLTQPHHAFGMGYALAVNWKWKDNDHCIFPWGIVHPGDWVPKDELYLYRNEALLFRQFHPVYETPDVLVLLPRGHWAGDYMNMYPYLVDFLGLLIDLGVDYGVLDEGDLERLPADARAVVYPLPHCAPEHVFPQLKAFVERGGCLWLSGSDRAFAQEGEAGTALRGLVGAGFGGWLGPRGEHLVGLARMRTLPQERIVGTRALPGLSAYDGRPCVRMRLAGAQIMATDSDGQPVMLRNALGKGQVLYTSDGTLPGARASLPPFLQLAGISTHPSGLPGVQLFRLPVQEGAVYTLTTYPWDRVPRLVEIEVGSGRVRLGLGVQGVGLVGVNRQGAPCAMEGVGLQDAGGHIVVEASGHIMLSAVGAEDLRDAGGLLLLPVEPGTVRIRSRQALEALLGDVVDGRWVGREQVPVQRTAGMTTLTLGRTAARGLLLLTTTGRRDQHIAWLEGLFS